jgi:DNA-binding NarL/FixJ family response regulator
MVAHASRRIRVVVIDDQEVIRLGVRAALESNRQVEIVADGAGETEALRLFCDYQPDVLLYGLNKITACELTGETFPACRMIRYLVEGYQANILVLSRHCHKGLVRSAICAGASGFMHKDEAMGSSVNLAQVIIEIAQKKKKLLLGNGLHQKLHPYIQEIEEIPQLTERRIEIMQAIADNPQLPLNQIAVRLGIAESTLRNNLSAVSHALDTPGLNGAMIECLRLGLVQISR